ncbi:MAG: Wadjet anti-phage system protein JetA family protein [Bacillota bacterium]
MAARERLFDYIPENLFSVLAGPLKELHAGLLFLVYDQYRRTIYTLPRETVIDLFCEYLESSELQEWPEDEEGQIPVQSIRDRASVLLRKFLDAKWLIQEQSYDYSFRISLPDYALSLLEVLDKIRTGYRMEFRGRILSIHQILTGEEGMSYVALQQAAEYTSELVDGLKRLSHSIKAYTEKLLEKSDPREIISHIFDEYHVQVLGEQYYRLKTSEHVSKYRSGILARVKEWQASRPEIVSQAARMVQERQAPDRLTGENTIYNWLEYIEESFTHMDELLEEIDRRNAQYARSAVEKLRFQLQQGRGVEQQIVAILRYLAAKARATGERDECPPEVDRMVRLFTLRTVDEFSIKSPSRAKREHLPRPIEPVEIDQSIRSGKLERFRRRVGEEITVEEINRYVAELLPENGTLPLSELPLGTREEWVRLIYIILYSRSRRARYILTGERGRTVLSNKGSAEVPALTVRRKDA